MLATHTLLHLLLMMMMMMMMMMIIIIIIVIITIFIRALISIFTKSVQSAAGLTALKPAAAHTRYIMSGKSLPYYLRLLYTSACSLLLLYEGEF